MEKKFPEWKIGEAPTSDILWRKIITAVITWNGKNKWMLPKIVLTLWIIHSTIFRLHPLCICSTCSVLLCTVSKYCVCEAYIKRGNDCDLRAYYLLWAGEEVCSNSGQSERQFWVFSLSLSLARWLGLSGPFVTIITWLLTASQLKIKKKKL